MLMLYSKDTSCHCKQQIFIWEEKIERFTLWQKLGLYLEIKY